MAWGVSGGLGKRKADKKEKSWNSSALMQSATG
jgi:hypothetical protein